MQQFRQNALLAGEAFQDRRPLRIADRRNALALDARSGDVVVEPVRRGATP